jgi:hypothetical protein
MLLTVKPSENLYLCACGFRGAQLDDPGKLNAGRKIMQLMVLILVLFTFISIAGFIGALFFGTTGAVALTVLGLTVSFIGIAFFIGR